jgi:hypothetical protein
MEELHMKLDEERRARERLERELEDRHIADYHRRRHPEEAKETAPAHAQAKHEDKGQSQIQVAPAPLYPVRIRRSDLHPCVTAGRHLTPVCAFPPPPGPQGAAPHGQRSRCVPRSVCHVRDPGAL